MDIHNIKSQREVNMKLREVSRMYEQKRNDMLEVLQKKQDQECTFKPRINKRHIGQKNSSAKNKNQLLHKISKAMTDAQQPPPIPPRIEASKDKKNAPVYERLYKQAEQIRQTKEGRLLRQKVMEQQLELDTLREIQRGRARSLSISSVKSTDSRGYTRAPLYSPKFHKNREAKLVEKKVSNEEAGCTFMPQINSKSTLIARKNSWTQKNVHNRLYDSPRQHIGRPVTTVTSQDKPAQLQDEVQVPTVTISFSLDDAQKNQGGQVGSEQVETKDTDETNSLTTETEQPTETDQVEAKHDHDEIQDAPNEGAIQQNVVQRIDAQLEMLAATPITSPRAEPVPPQNLEPAFQEPKVEQLASRESSAAVQIATNNTIGTKTEVASASAAFAELKQFGVNLEKHGRRGKPHHCRITVDELAFFWTSKKNETKRVEWNQIIDVLTTRPTATPVGRSRSTFALLRRKNSQLDESTGPLRRSSTSTHELDQGFYCTIVLQGRNIVLQAYSKEQRDKLIAAFSTKVVSSSQLDSSPGLSIGLGTSAPQVESKLNLQPVRELETLDHQVEQAIEEGDVEQKQVDQQYSVEEHQEDQVVEEQNNLEQGQVVEELDSVEQSREDEQGEEQLLVVQGSADTTLAVTTDLRQEEEEVQEASLSDSSVPELVEHDQPTAPADEFGLAARASQSTDDMLDFDDLSDDEAYLNLLPA